MAKRTAPDVEQEIIPAATPVEKEELKKEDQPAPVASVGDPAPAQASAAPVAQVKSPTKSVRIHCIENVDCIIAGVAYTYPKGKEVSVPTDVAAILSSSQKAYRM